MMHDVSIDSRFCGPPDSGNGGYVAGLLAATLGGPACSVTLLQPAPLEVNLRIECGDDEAALLNGEEPIAVATRAEVAIDVPPPPSLAKARGAETHFNGFASHIFPGCFVCGPERLAGDGLRIFPGRAEGGVASSWLPARDLTDGEGMVRCEFVWAALDCPGYFAVEEAAGLAVLGRMAAVRYLPFRVEQEVIVTGWPIASEGRKHRAGTALHDADGRLLAAAHATWITLRPMG